MLFGGETVTRFPRLAEHLRQHRRIQVALVQGGFRAAHHRGGNAGEGLEAAHGANRVGVFAGDGADFERQLGRRGQGIAARVHGRGAGMRFLPVKGDGVPLHALGAQHRAQRQPEGFEHRSLLDVQLDIRGGVLLFGRGFGESVDFDATAAERVFQANTVAIRTHPVGGDAVGSGKGRGAQQAAAETRAFFIRPVHQTDGYRRTAVVLCRDAAQHLEARQHVQAAVQPSAIGYRIQVAAD